MLCAFGFQFMRGSASAEPTAIPTSINVPRLLALETNIPPQPTATSVPPTPTNTLHPTPTQIPEHGTQTPWVLAHEQQAEVIGYSVEGRPIQIYTFGSGEHQRMIVATSTA